MSTLQWRELGPGDEPYWELCLPAGKSLTVFGRLYVAQDGYVVLTAPPNHTKASAYMLDDLTLDEAKRAAKLLLMAGSR